MKRLLQEASVKEFLKWTAWIIAAGVGVAVVYESMSALRRRVTDGLERAERIASEAEQAVSHTEQALGEAARTARAMRQSLG